MSRLTFNALFVGFALMLVSAQNVFANEKIKLEGTTVRGDQEQPQVLYILPWQTPINPRMELPAPKAEVLGTLEPIERQTFREQLFYRRNLKIGDLPTD